MPRTPTPRRARRSGAVGAAVLPAVPPSLINERQHCPHPKVQNTLWLSPRAQPRVGRAEGGDVVQPDPRQDPIEEVTVHPVFPHASATTEHGEGELPSPGDALGRDCWVVRFIDGWYRLHAGDGTRNEDWYSWGADVLAPFDGVVDSVRVNPVTNQPGHHAGGRASAIVFRRQDGVRVVYAHVDRVEVQPGDPVSAGQRIARVGNNGTSQCPHIHVGAWRDSTPLQIRFDLRALRRLQAQDPSRYYGYSIAK